MHLQYNCKMKINEILKEHNLRRTSLREGILFSIIDTNEALSENEIRNKLEGNYDRTTFYRAFKTLEDSGILHKIVVDGQHIKYGLSASASGKKPHAHFYCSKCDSVICLDIPLNLPVLPDGYKDQNAELIIKGLCNICNQSNQI
jgi:Fur family transcriptional regulator, ferric uptake regulator